MHKQVFMHGYGRGYGQSCAQMLGSSNRVLRIRKVGSPLPNDIIAHYPCCPSIHSIK